MTPGVVAVLTGGLTCGLTSACQGGTLLTAGPFSLYCPTQPEIPPAHDNTGGGSHPISSGWSQPLFPTYQPSQPSNNIYNPNNQTLVTNPNRMLGNKVPVTITFKLGDINKETIYMVDVNRRDIILKVGKLLHSIDHKARIRISKIRKKNHDIVMSIKNHRLFRNDKPD